MALKYLVRKSGRPTVTSTDGAEHPNAVLGLFYDVKLTLGSEVVLMNGYYHDLTSFQNGLKPLDYILETPFKFDANSTPTYTNALSNSLDINLITKDVTIKNPSAEDWILSQLDANGEALSVNWEFPV